MVFVGGDRHLGSAAAEIAVHQDGLGGTAAAAVFSAASVVTDTVPPSRGRMMRCPERQPPPDLRAGVKEFQAIGALKEFHRCDS
jgi:hypothetical protein